MEDVRKIAILRANGLGDFIVTLPAISAIKAAYPAAEIILLGKPWHAAFLKHKRTAIDRVITIPVYRHIREEKDILPDKREQERFFEEIQKEKIDIAMHFQGKGIAANPFLKRLHARITVGHSCPEATPIDYSIPYDYYQSEVLRYLELANLIGATPSSLEPEIRLYAEDMDEAETVLSRLALDKPYIVLHTGATDIRRRWPAEKFANLGDELIRKGYQILLTGDENDQEMAVAVLAQMREKAFHICGMLTLGGLGALLAKSALTIANDTGPLHLARAVGASTVGLYWAPNRINWGPLTLKNHRAVISWQMHCPKCGIMPNNPYPFEPQLPDCQHLFSFVEDISVAEVLHQAETLLAQNQDTLRAARHALSSSTCQGTPDGNRTTITINNRKENYASTN